MGNCKDCKHWESNVDCYGKRCNTCEAAQWVEREDKIPDDGLAIYAEASDDSGLNCGLKTGPMFGCVRFEQLKRRNRTHRGI